MNILVDLDGTVFRTYEVVGKLYKKEFGKELDWSVIHDKDLKFWKTKYGKFLLKCFKDPELNANIPICKDADKVLRAFAKKKGNQIFYCTARRPENWGATYKAFVKNNLPLAPIVFLTRDNVPEMKAKVAKAFDIDVAIDDEEVNLEALGMVCNIIQFGCDWEYGIGNWKDIKQIIL